MRERLDNPAGMTPDTQVESIALVNSTISTVGQPRKLWIYNV